MVLLSLLIISSPYAIAFLPYSLGTYPERHYPEKIRGIRFNTATILPMLLLEIPTVTSNLKELGVNSVYFPIFYRVNRDGSIDGLPFSKLVGRLLIRRFHSLGFSVAITPALLRPEGLSFGSLPEDILKRERFWDELENVIVDLSEMAEEEKVEIFFVLNEPEVVFGLHENASIERVSRMINFSKEILPKVREKFSGKIGWHAALGGGMVFYNETADARQFLYPLDLLNFSGYDYYGSTIIAVQDGEGEARRIAQDLVNIQLEICNMSGAELLFPETFWKKEEQIDFFKFYFEFAGDNLAGSFITLAPFGKEKIVKTITSLYAQ